MKKIFVKGTIISDNLQRIYDWIGIEATSPSKIINSLPIDDSDVEVVINSGGGDVFGGSEIFTALKEYQGNVTVKIVGLAASAASVIAMAGDKVLISPTAQMMVHNVSTYGAGDYRDFEHTANVLRSANKSIANAYKERTGKSDEELQSLMDEETWFNANTAVENGFADEIMFEVDKDLPLTANFGGATLNDEVIEKIMSMIDKKEDETPQSDQLNDSAILVQKNELENQLKYLQLKGRDTDE